MKGLGVSATAKMGVGVNGGVSGVVRECVNPKMKKCESERERCVERM